MSFWNLIDRSIKIEYFNFCYDCMPEKYDYIYEVFSFRIKESKEYLDTGYTKEVSDAKRKRSDPKSVKFNPSVITEYIESIWQDKEELDNYRRELDLQYPDISLEERAKRRKENYLKINQRIINNRSYDQLFLDYPSGLCNLPSYVDCMCDLGYESYVLRKKVALELSTAPPVFSHIHPFDENFTIFLNSYLDRPISERPLIKRKIGNDEIKLSTSIKDDIFNMPFEIERRLWVYRIAKFREWKLSLKNTIPPSSNNPSLNKGPIGICKYSSSYDSKLYPSKLIENPMMYFKY